MLFQDFLTQLSELGYPEQAEEYLLAVMFRAAVKGIDPDDTLSMDADEIVRLIVTPEEPYGWNTVWGEHIVKSS